MLMNWNKMVKYNMKKTFKITPFSNVGDIKFDSNREVVRKQLGKFNEFRKTRFSRNTTDDFGGFQAKGEEIGLKKKAQIFGGYNYSSYFCRLKTRKADGKKGTRAHPDDEAVFLMRS